MRLLATTALLALIAASPAAGQPPAPAPTDPTKASQMTAADLAAALAKLPGDRPASSVRVFTLAPYTVNVERRLPLPQGASLHEAQAELFHIIDGSGALLTGGTIPGATRNGTNLSGRSIEGGTKQAFAKGDFLIVPSGVAHQFVDLAAPVVVMSIYLPNQP